MPTHQNPDRWLRDLRSFVRQHPGSVVQSRDDPLRKILGFYVETPGNSQVEEFTINLTSFKSRASDPVLPYLLSTEARTKFALVLTETAPDLGPPSICPPVWEHLLNDPFEDLV